MKKIRKAVIPVAGLGTRFLPITKSLPKEMLPIVDRPTLELIVEEALESGIEEILLITNPYKKVIEDYFDQSFELEERLRRNNKLEELEQVKSISSKVKVYFIRQGEPLGNGHAVGLAKGFVGDEPFAVIFGDDVYKSKVPALKQLIEVYEKYDCNVIGGQEVERSVVNRYGIFEYDNNGNVTAVIEKPSIEEAPSQNAVTGRYILKPEIFDHIDKTTEGNKEIYLTTAMNRLMKSQIFRDCIIDGHYYDSGNKLEYLKANIDYGLEDKKLGSELALYIKALAEKI